MKKILPGFLLMLFISCSSRTQNTSTIDTMNGIDTRSSNDSTITHPDGYAPPNATIDTSQKTKDSINASKH